MKRLKSVFQRLTASLVQNRWLTPRTAGFRYMRHTGQRDYCLQTCQKFTEHTPARVVQCPLPVNVTCREELSRDCGRYERSFFDVPDFHVAASSSATVTDCRILRTRDQWGDDFYAIVTSDDQLLSLSGGSYRPEHAALLRSGRVTRSLEHATWVTTHSTRNHYMWLYTHLLRVMLAETLGLQHQILFPEKSLLSAVKLSTLGRLGYQEPQFVRADDEVIHVKHLSLLDADPFDPIWLVRLRDRLVGDIKEETPTRLYISREKCHYRKLRNEAEIWPELEKQGFEKVFLEDLTLEQQIRKLQSADVVLGVHGAGFANVLFCRPGTRIIEIQDPEDPNPHFYALAALLGLDYCLLIGDVDAAAESHFRDISVSQSALAGLLI